jgi:hypothetical protein
MHMAPAISIFRWRMARFSWPPWAIENGMSQPWEATLIGHLKKLHYANIQERDPKDFITRNLLRARNGVFGHLSQPIPDLGQKIAWTFCRRLLNASNRISFIKLRFGNRFLHEEPRRRVTFDLL